MGMIRDAMVTDFNFDGAEDAPKRKGRIERPPAYPPDAERGDLCGPGGSCRKWNRKFGSGVKTMELAKCPRCGRMV